MLNWIRINNLALIESADVEFGPGLNVITGETGAGKSILLGTIALLLGERADKSIIRTDTDRCEISANISINGEDNEEIITLLNKFFIPWSADDNEIQLRRIITKTQNRNFINDVPVTVQTLKLLGEHLIDIHSANEHQTLLSRTRQLTLLDRFGNLKNQRRKCSQSFIELQNLRKEKADFLAHIPSPKEAASLQNTINDIEKVSPQKDEDAQVAAKHALVANAKEILEITAAAVVMLRDGEDSISEQFAALYRHLLDLNRIDDKGTAEILTQANLISEQISDLAEQISNYAEATNLDEAAFMELENRLSKLQTLKRHYGPSLDNVLETWQNSIEQYEKFQSSDKRRSEFEEKEILLKKTLLKHAEILSIARRNASKKLCDEVKAKLSLLGFRHCQVDAKFTEGEPGENGMDQIDLMFSANPGEKPQPLRSCASSGELSRFMLALKTVLADADAVPVVIFDEIDVNIGGETACQVGKALLQLAEKRQLLCISHLPQVAVCGTQHYAVHKEVQNDRTRSYIQKLDPESRINEISRMLGNTPAARQHAIELLKHPLKD